MVDPALAPIFIIGSGRSGTTLFRNMLNAHPRIHVAFEPHFYWYASLYRKRRPVREFLDYYFQTPHFRWQRVDPARVLAQLPDPLTRDHMGLAFAAVLREKAALYGRVRFGDKTPAHASSLRAIFRDFPDARAIHISRDPRATALSLSRMPWAPPSLMLNAGYLETERRHVAPFAERMLQIRLEDLLGDARTTMKRVLDFVEEPWDDAVLDHANHQPDKDDVPPYPWILGASGDRVVPSKPYGDLTPVQIRMIEQMSKNAMRAGGYTRADLPSEPPWRKVFWAGIREIPQAFKYLWVSLPLAYRGRDPKQLDEVERELLRRVNPAARARYTDDMLPTAPPLRALPPSLG